VFFSYSQYAEFVSVCYDFDSVINITYVLYMRHLT